MELGKDNHCGKAYVLDVNEWNGTSHKAIDVYNCLSAKAMPVAGSGSSYPC